MRLRICCCYCTNQTPSDTSNGGSNESTLPRVVAEQPKRRQSIQLDKITEVSAEESAVQSKEDSVETVPDKGSTVIESEPLPADVQEIKSATKIVPVNLSPLQDDNSTTTPTVTSGQDKDVDSSDEETSVAVANGGSTEQSQSGLSFTVIAPGHLKSVYKGTEYFILNGKIEKINGDYDDSDEKFILANYESAMLGVQNAMLRIEQGVLGMQMNAAQVTQPLNQLLASYHPPDPPNPPRPAGPRNRPNQEAFEEFLRLLKSDSWRPERDRAVDTTDSVNRAVDTTDSVNQLGGYISEPPLKKTTFAPKEVVYEDPKTYENLDEFEIPEPKRADEYIISRDMHLSSGFHFHAAKPKRVRRKALDRKERLQIASQDRYSLFEQESLKVHNKFRSMHGVPPLVNNTFLSKVAREWAEHLALNDAFYHRPKNEYGENLFTGDRVYTCARKAVAAWYDEINLYDYKNPKFEKATGHFTQLIWKDTREVGTGVAQIGNTVWVCCNYHPPGNVLNKFNEEYVPRPVVIKYKS